MEEKVGHGNSHSLDQVRQWSEAVTSHPYSLRRTRTDKKIDMGRRPTTYVRNIKDSSKKNYGTSVGVASYKSNVIALPQHSLHTVLISRCDRPPQQASAA
ncbi:hypothetical protein EVAR_26467_1 [Eumeta japonica]|uniref:Uncharacterized protein n=1 Tax=Eumeta variegata TaxID=151549 RepID=A0A4C1Z451_EUMVA|nr:hypothetical protein EVAR_26467_1 [Eumeta japonica]